MSAVHDYHSALVLARERVSAIALEAQMPMEVVETETVEIAKGWAFFYQSVEYLKTGNFDSLLLGNGPIFVTREGAVHSLPTTIPWQEAIKAIR